MSDLSDRRTDLPPRAIGVPDTGQGLFQKFEVRRTDGSSEPGGKHEGCEYFVLDTDHDPYAAAALRAYASACEASHPLLARDLRQRYHLPAEMPLEVQWSKEMVSVPILRRFDQSDPIGWLQVRRDALPATPDWRFSIGYRSMQPTGPAVTDYQLDAVSITSDADYERVIDREKGRRLVEPTVHIAKVLRERAIGIARDVAAGFARRTKLVVEGETCSPAFVGLAEALLEEPELVKAIGAWCSAAENAVDGPVKPEKPEKPPIGSSWFRASPDERTHARRLMAKHCSLELRCTLSAHQEEWWALNREREASEADILQVLAAGLRARRAEPGRLMSEAQSTAAVDALREERLPPAIPGRCLDLAERLRNFTPESQLGGSWTAGMVVNLLEQVANAWDRRPVAGMNLSQEKIRSTGLGPVVIAETARWAGAKTAETDGAVHFTHEAWEKFVTSLSTERPLELMTSPGVSAPESVLHHRCIVRGCQEALPCPQGKCAMGPRQEGGA